MSVGVEFYKQQVQKSFSKNQWLRELQENALQDLEKLGMPTKKTEDWKYTPLDQFLKHDFSENTVDDITDKHALEVIATGRQVDVPVGIKVPLINGTVVGLDGVKAQFPPGVIVASLEEALAEHPELLEKYLQKVLVHSNGMEALNTAMLKFGLFIYVPKNIDIAEPILISHASTESDKATFLRHMIVAEKGSSVRVIEDYQGSSASNYFTNVVTEVFVHEGANVQHYKVQREGAQAFHFGHVVAKQLRDSNFATHLLSIGGKWARSDTTIDLTAENANCLLNGVYMPVGSQHMDQQTKVNHQVANCFSEQDYRGLAADSAHAVFNGKIFVAKDAIATTAKQQNKNLLLSNSAQIYTKPQLEIFADDVVCTHGATVGQLDADALFYFATRGIAEQEAKRYLLQAFAADNINKVDDKELSSWMSSLLEQQMG